MALLTKKQPTTKNSYLSTNLLRVVLSIYLLVAVTVTSLQLKIEYDITKKNLEYEIIFNGKSIIEPLSLALWNFDSKQVKSIKEVIRENKNISHVDIIDLSIPTTTTMDYSNISTTYTHNIQGVSVFEVQHDNDGTETIYKFDIFHKEAENSIGTLYIHSKKSILYSEIKPLFIITIINALIKIFVITIAFYIVFYQMVGKRLKILKAAITDFNDSDNDFENYITAQNDELGDIFTNFRILKNGIIQKNMEINNQKRSLEVSVSQRTEQLEKALNALEKSNSFKSQFLANMSHEIRTPMNGIIGVAELIKDTELTTEQKNHINTILNSGHALTTIINDILDFSKIEAGKMELECIEFNIRDLVDETLQLFRKQIQDSTIFLGTEIDVNVPNIVLGDPTRVRQILLNLIGNAFKFTNEGEIYVQISILEINPSNNGLKLKYAITDTGIGIEQKRKNELFSAFTQADASISRNYGGTGLGLAISKRLSILMNGNIGFESELEKGSTFWFTGMFKTLERQPSLDENTLHIIPDLLSKKLLIVEPNTRLNNIISIAAEDWGMMVHHTENTQSAKKLLLKNEYDFIIIDNVQPDMEGLIFCEQMFDHTPKPDVILLNKTSLDIDKNRLEKAAIYQIMAHPITANKLKSVLITKFKSKETVTIDHDVDNNKFDLLKLLVAEDNNVNQIVIKGFLKKLNVTAEVCENGLIAYNRTKQEGFNIILMDCEMPEMDGYEATRKIKSEHPDIIIIGLSAHALEEHKLKALDAGMDDYITKPIKRDQLAQKLEYYQNIIANQKQ